MDRTLRTALVLLALLVIAGLSFAMGFGTAYALGIVPVSRTVSGGSGPLVEEVPAATHTPLPTFTASPQQTTSPTPSAAPATPTPALTPSSTPAAPATRTARPQPTARPAAVQNSGDIYKDVEGNIQIFWEALRRLSDNYYDKRNVSPQALINGAIKGMVDSIGDPHTYFSLPPQVKQSRENLEGSFEGIGATIEKKDNKLQIVAPMADSPAQKAGLRPGDWIIRIDGKDASTYSAADGATAIRGPKGTRVTLTIVRDGSDTAFDVTLTRATVSVPNVRLTMLDDGIARIELVNIFSSKMADDLKATLQEARQQGAKKLILDMRGNPGGYLRTAVDVASQFLKEGNPVVLEQDRNSRRTAIDIEPGGLATDLPLVVLVNRGSASATEIVAGAIQDLKRAPLIGEVTFGKGSVQQDFALSDGSALHVTIAHWLTPNGRDINNIGLTPDIEVPLTEEDSKAGRDPQLARAVQYLKTGQ